MLILCIYNRYICDTYCTSTCLITVCLTGAQGGYVGIINGTVVQPYSRPYMVSVQKGQEHICGGFLVSESFVMTAAHCITG